MLSLTWLLMAVDMTRYGGDDRVLGGLGKQCWSAGRARGRRLDLFSEDETAVTTFSHKSFPN